MKVEINDRGKKRKKKPNYIETKQPTTKTPMGEQ